jgi:hypothetical protein
MMKTKLQAQVVALVVWILVLTLLSAIVDDRSGSSAQSLGAISLFIAILLYNIVLKPKEKAVFEPDKQASTETKNHPISQGIKVKSFFSVCSIIALSIILFFICIEYKLGDNSTYIISIIPGILCAFLKPYINLDVNILRYSFFSCLYVSIPLFFTAVFDRYTDFEIMILPIISTFVLIFLILKIKEIIINHIK